MTLPSTVKSGAIIYQVMLAEDWLGRGDADGMVEHENNTIYIYSKLSPEIQLLTLIHEVLHTFNSTVNHEFLDSLAVQILAFLRDNNLLSTIYPLTKRPKS
jgi:Zn-dependent peptidase ImmA (M78 family)